MNNSDLVDFSVTAMEFSSMANSGLLKLRMSRTSLVCFVYSGLIFRIHKAVKALSDSEFKSKYDGASWKLNQHGKQNRNKSRT